nr:hypothetical protein [bacterium]
NNEGFYPPTGGYVVRKTPNDQLTLGSTHDTSLHQESLAIQTDEGLLSSGEIRVPIGGQYRLRAHIRYEGEEDSSMRRVLFYQENPEFTDEIIGVKNVPWINPDTYIWHYWTPDEVGKYELWAVLLEHSRDLDPGNATDRLEVTVFDPNDTAVDHWMIHN